MALESAKEKLNDDAEKLADYGKENHYLETAFYNVFGKRLINQGYVDGSYILNAVARGNYYSQLKDSNIRKLYTKTCVVSENVEIMLGYLTNIVGKSLKLDQLEEEALIFWIFLPYLAASKREKRKIYLLCILQKILQKWFADEDRIGNLAVYQSVVFDKSMCSIEVVTSVEDYARYIFSLKKAHEHEVLFYRGHSQLNYLLQPGIKRKQHWLEKEDIMYQELLVRCAQDFVHCHTH